MPGVAFWDTAELQAVGPLMGTAHPTGFPTYVLRRLARVGRPPAVRRAGVPDEPAVGDLRRRSRPAVTVDLVRAADGLARARAGGRHRTGAHADRLGDRRPTPRPTRSTWRSWRSCSGCWSPGRSASARLTDRAERRSDATGRRPPIAATATWSRRPRLRAGRRQPLADAPAGRPGRAVRARRRSGDLAARPARR